MKKLIIGVLVGALLTLGLPLGSASAAPYCGIAWGSAAKSNSASNYASRLINVRTGQHSCYDRIVFDLTGPAVGYYVSYVSNVSTEGEGKDVPLSGGAKLLVVVRAPTYDSNGKSLYLNDPVNGKPPTPVMPGAKLPRVNLTGYQTFRDAKYAGSFEGQSSFGLGVRAKLPFRVVKDGNKVYVDVAHYW